MAEMNDLPEWMDPKFLYDEGGYDLGQIRGCFR